MYVALFLQPWPACLGPACGGGMEVDGADGFVSVDQLPASVISSFDIFNA